MPTQHNPHQGQEGEHFQRVDCQPIFTAYFHLLSTPLPTRTALTPEHLDLTVEGFHLAETTLVHPAPGQDGAEHERRSRWVR